MATQYLSHWSFKSGWGGNYDYYYYGYYWDHTYGWVYYAWNSMGTIIIVEAKPICVKVWVKHTTKVATRVIPNEN